MNKLLVIRMNNGPLVLRRENPSNVYITKNDVSEILSRYGINITVNNIDFFQRAFVHRSYLKVENPNVIEETVENCTVPLQEHCNERLELLGDCILGSVVGTYLFLRFDDQAEGFLTKTKTKIIRGKTLAKLGRRMNFGKWVIISLHVETEGGRNNRRILEDLFECFIGALYMDNGGDPISDQWFTDLTRIKDSKQRLLELEAKLIDIQAQGPVPAELVSQYINAVQNYRELSEQVISKRSNGYLICQKFIMNVLEKELDLIKLIQLDDNYKDQLQHYFQKNFKGIFPQWDLLKLEGPTNDRWHVIGIKDDRGVLIGIGRARKKIEAEQLASKQALKHLGVEVMSDSDGEEDYYMKKHED